MNAGARGHVFIATSVEGFIARADGRVTGRGGPLWGGALPARYRVAPTR